MNKPTSRSMSNKKLSSKLNPTLNKKLGSDASLITNQAFVTRRLARIKVFELVYGLLFGQNNLSQEYFDRLDDGEYIKRVFNRVVDNWTTLNAKIENQAIGYKDNRLYKVDKAIMIVALCEIEYCAIPLQVAINEAVELAKIYSTKDSAKFINGVLAGILN